MTSCSPGAIPPQVGEGGGVWIFAYGSLMWRPDFVHIEARPALLRGSVLKFAYRILRKAHDGGEPALLAEGETVHVVCDDQLQRKALPAHYAEALRGMMAD